MDQEQNCPTCGVDVRALQARCTACQTPLQYTVQAAHPRQSAQIAAWLVRALAERQVPEARAKAWISVSGASITFRGPGKVAAFVAERLRAGGLTPTWALLTPEPAPAAGGTLTTGTAAATLSQSAARAARPSPAVEAARAAPAAPEPAPIPAQAATPAPPSTPAPATRPDPQPSAAPAAQPTPTPITPSAGRPRVAPPSPALATLPTQARVQRSGGGLRRILTGVVALGLIGGGVWAWLQIEPEPPVVQSTQIELMTAQPGTPEDAAYALEGAVHLTAGDAVAAGVVISEAGHILTLAKGLPESGEVKVRFSNGLERFGRIVEFGHGLAVIKALKAAKTESFSPADLTEIPPRPDAAVHVLSSPHGLKLNLRPGTVTRLLPDADPASLTIDRSVMPGNVGGPVFDASYRLIGLASDTRGGVRDLTFAPEILPLLGRYAEQVASEAELDWRWNEKAVAAVRVRKDPRFVKVRRSRSRSRSRRRGSYSQRYYYVYWRRVYFIYY